MTKYNTTQRREIEKLFFENLHTTLSAKQIHEKLPQMSISTIYRNLSSMQRDGLISVVKTDDKESGYHYLDPQSCIGIIHLICSECKSTYHIDKNISKMLVDIAKDSIGFNISKENISLYGKCKECSDD